MAPSQASKAQNDLSTLRLTVTSTLSLINQFTTSLSTPQTSPTRPPTNAPNPLDVLHTTATLLKAQTTKLSLLVLNKPFTPPAISTILRDVSTSCLPALMSAVEIYDPEKDSKILHDEVRLRVRRVLREFASLVEEIPVDNANGNGSKDGAKKDQLASTGVVWEACDSLIALRNEGLVGLVVKKVENWRAMIEDAISELKEWSEDEANSDDDEEDDTNSASSGSNDVDGNGNTQDEINFEDIFGTTQRLPKGPTPLRTQLEASLRNLSLIKTLYQGLIKRRLQNFKSSTQAPSTSSLNSGTISTLDQLITHLSYIPSETDELANAFYRLNLNEVTEYHNRVIQIAKDAASLATPSWNGEEDESTEWFKKWLRIMNRP
ncbi:MAG: hypothetical protein M1812_003268 [Candelaria pacifica]|nr:MAG: hypothetical protein M1812_003268 [Candelaria pacifica]